MIDADLSWISWRKSSRSMRRDNCAEVGMWCKSGHSAGNSGECVEVAPGNAMVPARDSKDPDGPVLGFEMDERHAFVFAIKAGQLDPH
ncbi:protein of unknown function [Thermomonospora echinospora]|uniref:DUF397 domain-containing protein n=1 Tax=Thermomonospora echinospora TaxID=1992 RepID=A0A1H6AVN2_9ACTN|nr:DUF397 domain-containing protein [Thermomonospora echinospora]SEG52344.1 protein of unknown function [Thermomonospora echinospora]